MSNIIVPRTYFEVSSQLVSLLRVLKQVDWYGRDSFSLDMTRLTFVNPLPALPLHALYRFKQDFCDAHLIKSSHDSSLYLNNIGFGKGTVVDSIQDLERFRASYKKSFIPIVDYAVSNSEDLSGGVSSHVYDLLDHNLGLGSTERGNINYLIGEAFDNIREHSISGRGYIYAQTYSRGKFLDLCIVDTGVGIRDNYVNHGIPCQDDKHAISMALDGRSTKDLPDKERGYGISTSLRLLTEGLKGTYTLMSGEGVLVKYGGKQQKIANVSGCYWQGTIVHMRIPAGNLKRINCLDYVE